MRGKWWLGLFLMTVVTAGWAGTVDFETAGAPCMFVYTPALTDQYAAEGVTFNGGGTVLNQCGNFGVAPHSGTDLLGFHIYGYGTGPEVLTFAAPVTSVSIWVTSGVGNDTFQLVDSNGLTASAVALQSMWTQLTLSGPGITQVTLTELGHNYSWVADDLSWTNANLVGAQEQIPAVPEPVSLVLFGSGLVGLGRVARKSRK